MSVKKYYWVKLDKNFFKRHDIKIIEGMPNGDKYIILYLKLILETTNHEGRLRFSETIPYNDDMIATVTNTDIDVVRSAMKLFVELEFMQVLDDQTLYFHETTEMVGYETEWAKKKREYRIKQEENKQQLLEDKKDIVPTLSYKSKEKEKELEIDIKDYGDSGNPYHKTFDTFWKSYPKKVGKGIAIKSFNKQVKDKPTMELILQDLEKRKGFEGWTKDKGKWIPNPSTYLNSNSWLDEYETKRSTKHSGANIVES